jgi:hypothetical protein
MRFGMWNLIFNICICVIVYLYGVRNVTAYYKESHFKKFIVIRNSEIANILISKRFSAMNFETDMEDRNKMSITGVISYVYMIISIVPFVFANIFLGKTLIQLFYCIFFMNLPVSLFLFILNNFSVLMDNNVGYKGSKMRKIGRYFDVGATIFMLLILLAYSIYLIMSIHDAIIQLI